VSSSPTETAVDLTEVTMPQMGVSVAEGTLVAWRVAVGDRVEAEQTICEVSTDKIDTEVPAPAAGIVAELLVAVDETVAVGSVLARLAGTDPAGGGGGTPGDQGASGAGAGAGTERVAPRPISTTHPSPGGARRHSPVVQRIAAEHGIDLTAVTGTGRGGRVRKQDVLALVPPPLHTESPYRPEPPAAAPAPAPAAGGDGTGDGGGLSRMRRQIGAHMKRSLQTAATCTTWAEADMSQVEAARARLGVTALAFVARATIETLREHPALNAWLEGDAYTSFDRVHLGIAVSLGEEGLIVPVIHDAQELSVEGLAARIRALSARARAGELSPDEVRGGTFTITNPGQYGSIMATPVINQPQVAILDLEAVVKRPVVVTDEAGRDAIAIRPMTILGLSWDHRALDGALAARFLAGVGERLGRPPA
jgi:pyruvate/2-oxoglutarate dehydrogenase complex dihydrolipoamide acyltransferase (E2) component